MATDMAAFETVVNQAAVLGAPVAEFKGAPKRGFFRFFGLLLLIGGEAALMVGFVSPYIFDPDVKTGFQIGGGIAAVIGLLFVIAGIRYEQAKVSVYTNGLESKRGKRSQTLRWSEIANIWQAVTKHYTNFVYTGTTHTYTLQLRDGQKVIFNDSIRKVEQLGELIQRKVTDVLMPEVITNYNAGQTIGFGSVAISRAGLTKGKDTIPWTEVETAWVEKGYLKVRKKGGRFAALSVSVNAIPNLFVLLVMIDRIVGIRK